MTDDTLLLFGMRILSRRFCTPLNECEPYKEKAMKLDVVTPDRIMDLGHAFFASRALLSAVELGVFTALADGPLDLEALRKRVGIHDRGARDFLDALVALGMLVRQDGRYANSAETGLYLHTAWTQTGS